MSQTTSDSPNWMRKQSSLRDEGRALFDRKSVIGFTRTSFESPRLGMVSQGPPSLDQWLSRPATEDQRHLARKDGGATGSKGETTTKDRREERRWKRGRKQQTARANENGSDPGTGQILELGTHARSCHPTITRICSTVTPMPLTGQSPNHRSKTKGRRKKITRRKERSVESAEGG